MADWNVVSHTPVTDPWAVVSHTDTSPSDSTLKQIAMAPVGAAEEFLKAGTGALAAIPAGLAYGGAAVGKALGADVNPAEIQNKVGSYLTYQPASNSGKAADQALADTYSPVAKAVASKADEAATAVGKVSPTAETFLREAPAAAQAAAGVLPVVGAAAEGVNAARAAVPKVARDSADVATEAGYTSVRTRADLNSAGNKKVTDALISKDAGIPNGTAPSTSALETARSRGPGRVYSQAQNSLPGTLIQDPELRDALASLQDGTSQMPKSPDVADLQKSLLDQPHMTNTQLFNNVREARERAAAYLASDDPDKNALGDAYHGVANAYEEFIGRQLAANPDSPVTLQQFQQARTQFAKNYLAQSALRGDHFDPMVYGRTAQRNPNLLTGHAAIVGHVANSLESAGGGVGASVAPVAAGALGGEAAGHLAGVPGVGAAVGAIAAPLVRDAVHNFLTRGDLGKAAAAADNPALSYFFQNGEMSPGWNRSPSQKPMLALPAPAMVNAGGGAATPGTLTDLGLTPDVQAAAESHPGAPRPGAPLPPTAPPPPPPVEFRSPENWSSVLQPNGPVPAPAPRSPASMYADVLSQGVEKPPEPGLSLAQDQPTPQGIPFVRNAAHEAGDLQLAPEDAWFTPGAKPTPKQYADVLSQGVPAKFRDRGAPQSPVRNNASGESAASIEAINRGTRSLAVIDPDGKEHALLKDVTQIDRKAPKGSLIIDTTNGEIIDRGGMTRALANGLRNRWAAQEAASTRQRLTAQALRN